MYYIGKIKKSIPLPNQLISHPQFNQIFMKKNLLLAILGSAALSANAQSFTETFEDITTLTNWELRNESPTVGSTDWFQGNPAVMPSYDLINADSSDYIGANFNSTTGAGDIDTWLFAPEVSNFSNGDTLSFWTRTIIGTTVYPDRLYAYYTTEPGSTATLDFRDNLIVVVNPDLTIADYPGDWTNYTTVINSVPNSAAGVGRIAFNYNVTDGGPSGANSNFIGLDLVHYGDYVQGVGTQTVQNSNVSYSFFPNPTVDVLTVSFNEPTIANQAIEIYDMTGKAVYSASVAEGTSTLSIDVKGLSAGAYLLEVYKNKQVIVDRFVKQ